MQNEDLSVLANKILNRLIHEGVIVYNESGYPTDDEDNLEIDQEQNDIIDIITEVLEAYVAEH